MKYYKGGDKIKHTSPRKLKCTECERGSPVRRLQVFTKLLLSSRTIKGLVWNRLKNNDGFTVLNTVFSIIHQPAAYSEYTAYDFSITWEICSPAFDYCIHIAAFTQIPKRHFNYADYSFIILIHSRYKCGIFCHIYSSSVHQLSFKLNSLLSCYDTYCNLKQTSIWSASSVHGKPMHLLCLTFLFLQSISFFFLICFAK